MNTWNHTTLSKLFLLDKNTWYKCVWTNDYRQIKKYNWKIVMVPTLLNTQQYKVRIKGKVEQFRERSSALPYTSV